MFKSPRIDHRELETYNPRASEPTSEHRLLSKLAGRWRIAGRNLDGAPDKPGATLSGESHYEWLPGNFYLVGRETITYDGTQHVTLMVFGFDDHDTTHFVRFFDNGGFSRLYALTIEGPIWQLFGRQERARIRFSDDEQSASYYWERTEDEGQNWKALCEFTSTRVS
jgi:hypothetical protein